MIELYGPARSSAGRCLWLLEELGIPYENKKVDLMNKEHKADWFLKINPNGKVPALVDGDVKIFESVAINYYLTEKFRPEFFGKSIVDRANTHQWSFWVMSEVQPKLIEILIQKVFVPEGKKDLALIESNEKELPPLFEVLNSALADKKFINGNEFTLADLNVASVISIATPIGFDLNPYPNIKTWLNNVCDRPSFSKYQQLRK